MTATRHRLPPTTTGCRCAVAKPPRRVIELLLCVLLVSSGGCSLVAREGPVPKSVATCRQLSHRGVTALDRGRWEEAEGLLAQAIKTCPVDANARRHYAEVLWHRGAMSEALAQLEEAIHLSGDEATLYVRAGEMYFAVNRYDEALQQAQQALDLDPQSASAWKLRAAVYEAGGQTEQALADLQQALNLRRDDAELLMQTAEVYRRLGRPQRALSTLQSLIDNQPRGEEPQQALYLQGLAFVALGRHGEAVTSLELATQRGEPSSELWCRLGEAQMLVGQPEAAESSLRKAFALQPTHAPSQALWAKLQVARRDSRNIR